ncbi:MAG: RnfH family protein [Luteimonas sp.]
MKVEVVMAWPRRHQSAWVELAETASVGDALAAAGFAGIAGVIGYAIHGQRAVLGQALRHGDRVELLRALQADPKDARRIRAANPKKT